MINTSNTIWLWKSLGINLTKKPDEKYLNSVIFTSFSVFLGCEKIGEWPSRWDGSHGSTMGDISLGFMEDIAMVTISGLVREIIPKWPQDSG
jgi:hypothetical protein